MTQRDHILTELRELSSVVAEVPGVNVYKVPEGYFDAVAFECLMAVCPPASFSGGEVPEGYFNNLPSIILEKIKMGEVLRETNDISTVVAGISNKNIFTVPEQYFETLPATLSAIIPLSSSFANAAKENVYTVPSGYFSKLSDEILARLKNQTQDDIAEETKAVSPLIAGIGNKNVYSVPQQYFENLAGDVLKNANTTKAKVVSMKGRFHALKYAAAAAITGIIAFSLFFILNNNEPVPNAATSATMAAAEKIIETNSFEQEMNSISDQAIVSFLESKGEDVEAALVASLVDDKNLPEITDYLINEQTLDEILQTVSISN